MDDLELASTIRTARNDRDDTSWALCIVADRLTGAEERIADLERAAETTRAEHATALGLATARIRELKGERDELLGLVKDDCDAVLSGLRNGGAINAVKAVKARIVARIEKAKNHLTR